MRLSGLHGVGVSAVNALSEWLVVQVRKDGWVYEQRYEYGVPKSEVKKSRRMTEGEEGGTTVMFLRDPTIFKEQPSYRFDHLQQRLREMSFLTRGVTVRLEDERTAPHRTCTFYFEGGIASFVRHLNKNRTVLFPKPIHIEKQANGTQVEVALQYNDGYAESVYSFANNVNTVDGATHLTGFRSDIRLSQGNLGTESPLAGGQGTAS